MGSYFYTTLSSGRCVEAGSKAMASPFFDARRRAMRVNGHSVVRTVWATAAVLALSCAASNSWMQWDGDPLTQAPDAVSRDQGGLDLAHPDGILDVLEDTPWLLISAIWECRDVGSEAQCRPVVENLGVHPVRKPKRRAAPATVARNP
jgi:hypothetical protein